MKAAFDMRLNALLAADALVLSGLLQAAAVPGQTGLAGQWRESPLGVTIWR